MISKNLDIMHIIKKLYQFNNIKCHLLDEGIKSESDV